MISVVVYASVRLYREGIVRALERERHIDVLSSAAELGDALARIAALHPDVLVIDGSLPRNHEVIRTIVASQPDSKIVAVGVPDTEDDVVALAELGVTGYVTRNASAAELVEAVDHASNGEILYPPQIVGKLARRLALLATERAPNRPLERLTTREREVALLINEGLSNKQIAVRLQIEVATVKNHVHHVLEKLEVSRRSEAAARLRSEAVV